MQVFRNTGQFTGSNDATVVDILAQPGTGFPQSCDGFLDQSDIYFEIAGYIDTPSINVLNLELKADNDDGVVTLGTIQIPVESTGNFQSFKCNIKIARITGMNFYIIGNVRINGSSHEFKSGGVLPPADVNVTFNCCKLTTLKLEQSFLSTVVGQEPVFQTNFVNICCV